MTTLDTIKKILSDCAGIDESKIVENATLKDLDLDSIDLAELICNLEDELEIDFGNPTDLNTIGDVIAHIEKVQNS